MNIELGRAVLDHVTAHPEEHDQGTYGTIGPCGTQACIAGHAMLRSGYTLTLDGFRRPDGSLVLSDSGEAQRLLDLTDDEIWPDFGRYLFGAHLSSAEAVSSLQRLIIERGESLWLASDRHRRASR